MYLNAEAGKRSGVLEQGFFNGFLLPNLQRYRHKYGTRWHFTNASLKDKAFPLQEMYQPESWPLRWCR